MKTKLAYFQLDGQLLLDILQSIPNTITTLPADTKYMGILVNRNLRLDDSILKIAVISDSFPVTEIHKAAEIREITPTWTKIK